MEFAFSKSSENWFVMKILSDWLFVLFIFVLGSIDKKSARTRIHNARAMRISADFFIFFLSFVVLNRFLLKDKKGGRWELNPRQQRHKLLCYRYTTSAITNICIIGV